LALRLAVFSGPTQGDDFAYLEHAHDWTLGVFDPARLDYVYGLRYGIILPVAAAMRVLGTSPLAVTLPSLVASLLGLLCALIVGRELGGRAVGLAAAALVAVTPISVLSGTYVLPEAFLDLALWASLSFMLIGSRRASKLLLFAAGLAGGYSYLVRSYGLVLAGLGAIPIFLAGRRPVARWLWFLAGLAVFPAAEMTYHAATTGDALWSMHLQARVYEHLGNLHNSLFFYPGILIRPDWALGILPALTCLAIFAAWGLPAVRFGLSWTALWLAVLEFSPMELHPLVWIQKEPRYLSVLVLPMALCTAAALVEVWRTRRSLARGVAIGLCAVLVGVAGLRSWQTARAYHGYMEKFRVVGRAVRASGDRAISFPHFRWALRVNYFAGYPDGYRAYAPSRPRTLFRVPHADDLPRAGEWVVDDPGFFGPQGEWKLPHDPLPHWMSSPPTSWPERVLFEGGRVLEAPTQEDPPAVASPIRAAGDSTRRPASSGLSGAAGRPVSRSLR
jgi:hypothetical protein